MTRTAMGKAPASQLAKKAARKSAPAYGGEAPASQTHVDRGEDHSEGEDVSEEESAQDYQTSASITARDSAAQRQLLFNRLLAALCSPSHEKYGAFAAYKSIPEKPFLSTLHVSGVGDMSLPLSAKEILKLRGVCEQVSFGKGVLTVDGLKLTFPGAPKFIWSTMQLLASRAVRRLGRYGVAVKLEAQFNKLMLLATVSFVG